MWSKATIQILGGEKEAITPVIISENQSTDIPAFHTDWLLHRLEVGYSVYRKRSSK